MGRFYDLTGMVFGKLKVLGRSEPTGSTKNSRWKCTCECGNTLDVIGQGLRIGQTTHCGCTARVSGPKDISGQRFGRLTAIRCTGEKNKGGNYIWEFSCDCGNRVTTPAGNVVFGHTNSCGCFRIDELSRTRSTHGWSKSKEYKSWCKAKERTRCKTCKSYQEYGGSGVGMCDEFYESFEAFFQHVGEMPNDGLRYTLGRIDNSKGYERDNVRWETDKQQARNKGRQTNNSSGFSGVTWDAKPWEHGIKLYAKAQWNDLSGRVCARRFSVDNYGLLPAFSLACAYRTRMIEELNQQGAGYSPMHGK